MKVLLLQDVYNLGRAGEIKKVANGYGRNYLIPQGFALLATQGALVQADRIRDNANRKRAILNEELSGVAQQMANVTLHFPARAGETGKLYGSVTTQMVADALSEKIGFMVDKRQIESEPLRQLGMHTIRVHLTIDLIPQIPVIVYREGENPENYMLTPEDMDTDEASEPVKAAKVVEEVVEVLEEVAVEEDDEDGEEE